MDNFYESDSPDRRTSFERSCDMLAAHVEQRFEELKEFEPNLKVARNKAVVRAKVRGWLCMDEMKALAKQVATLDGVFDPRVVRLVSLHRRAVDKLVELGLTKRAE